MLRAFRGVFQAITDTGSGLRTARMLGRGVRELDRVVVMQQPGFLSSPNADDPGLIIQIDGLLLAIGGESSKRPKAATGEALVHAGASCFIRVMPDGAVRIEAKKIVLGDDGDPTPTSGVVTGECLDPFTGLPFPDASAVVFARKVAI